MSCSSSTATEQLLLFNLNDTQTVDLLEVLYSFKLYVYVMVGRLLKNLKFSLLKNYSMFKLDLFNLKFLRKISISLGFKLLN